MDKIEITRDIISMVIAPLVTAIIAGVSFLVRHWLKKADESRKTEIEERNKRRDEIERKQAKMEKDLNTLLAMLSSCDHQDCKVRPLVVNYLLDRANKISNNNNNETS